MKNDTLASSAFLVYIKLLVGRESFFSCNDLGLTPPLIRKDMNAALIKEYTSKLVVLASLAMAARSKKKLMAPMGTIDRIVPFKGARCLLFMSPNTSKKRPAFAWLWKTLAWAIMLVMEAVKIPTIADK